jgi:uncharacterized membrane protein YfcA
MTFDLWQYGLMVLAACACSFINAVAGGGLLVLYPALTAIGVPPVASVANLKIGLFPGSVMAIIAQRKLLEHQTVSIPVVILTSFFGAVFGSWVLVHCGDESFKWIVPWLIILASLLMAFNKQLRNWIATHNEKALTEDKRAFAVGNFLFGFYAGYFGAGHGFLFFGLLSFFYTQGLKALNALRQIVVTSSHVASALFFIFATVLIDWKIVGVIFLGSMIGGFMGGKFSAVVDQQKLKKFITVFGLSFGIYLLLKNLGVIPQL